MYAASMDITRLAERRKRLGISRYELARQVGVNAVTMWRWETGVSQPIRIAAQQLDQVLCRLEAERLAAP